MARPFDESENIAAGVFDKFPDWVQEDEIFQRYFDHLFDPGNNWDEAHEWHDALDAYLHDEWDIDIDLFFDWEDWRESYKAHAS
jgi:hypothetical protein